MLVFTLSLLLVMLWYSVYLLLAIRKKGLDPTLITYGSPLAIRNFSGSRLYMITTLVLSVVSVYAAGVAIWLLSIFGIVHIFLLVLFNRSPTQPLYYYTATSLAVFALVLPVPLLLPLFIIFVAQELLLRHWQRNRLDLYNNWVARQAIAIDRKYKPANISDADWLSVLHFAVTESIARPWFVRLMERMYFYLFRPVSISTGIMQVSADRPLSDQESVTRGANIITKAIRSMPATLTTDLEKLHWIANQYNGRSGSDATTTGYSSMLQSTYPGLFMALQKN